MEQFELPCVEESEGCHLINPLVFLTGIDRALLQHYMTFDLFCMGNEALAVEVFQYWKFSEGGFIVLMEQYKESLNCLLFHTLQKKEKKNEPERVLNVSLYQTLKKTYFYDYNLTARSDIMKATHPHIRSAPSQTTRILFLQYSMYMNCFLLHNIFLTPRLITLS